MTELDPHVPLVRATDVLFSPLAEGEGALLSLEAGLYFSLNRTAVVVWTALEQPRTIAQLVDLVCGRFKVEPEQAARDLQKLLGELLRRKLVAPAIPTAS